MKVVKCTFDLMITYPFQLLMSVVQIISTLTLGSISKHTLKCLFFLALCWKVMGSDLTRSYFTKKFSIKHLEYVTKRK